MWGGAVLINLSRRWWGKLMVIWVEKRLEVRVSLGAPIVGVEEVGGRVKSVTFGALNEMDRELLKGGFAVIFSDVAVKIALCLEAPGAHCA